MRSGIASLAMVVTTFGAMAQVENDDMYFRSRDRVKLNEQASLEGEQKKEDGSKDFPRINPTDSYSTRNINPDYVSRMKTNPSSQDGEEGYFISGYQPTGVNGDLYSNYGPGYYSPYYGNSWNPYCSCNRFGYNAFMNPYRGLFQPGMSMSMMYGWNSGWASNMYYGMGSSWGYPSSYYMNDFYDPFYGWGGYNSFYNSYSPFSTYYSGYYPNVVVINSSNRDSNGRRTVYGKRDDRSSSLNNIVDHSRPVAGQTSTGRAVSSGRTRSEAVESQQFYDRSWRSNSQGSSQSGRTFSSGNDSRSSGSFSQQPRSSSWDGGNSGYTPSRSSDGGGFRSSGSSFSSGSSGGSSSGGGAGRSSGGGGSSGGSSGGGRGRN